MFRFRFRLDSRRRRNSFQIPSEGKIKKKNEVFKGEVYTAAIICEELSMELNVSILKTSNKSNSLWDITEDNKLNKYDTEVKFLLKWRCYSMP